MARSVGGVNFNLMFGTVTGLKTAVDVYVNPGQAGPGAQDLGGIDGEFRLVGVAFDSSPATFLATCEALQGTVVTVTDALGISGNCLVNKVDTTSGNGGKGGAVACIVNGAASARCEVSFQLTRIS